MPARRLPEHHALAAELDLVPQALPDLVAGIVGLALDDVQRKVLGHRDPIPLRPEERLRQHDAADLDLLERRDLLAAVLADTAAHLLERRDAIGLAEPLPGGAMTDRGEVGEQPTAYDEVLGRVELEEEELARRERAETAPAAGLPEVHLVEERSVAQEAEPVVVGDADPEAHPVLLRSQPNLCNQTEYRKLVQCRRLSKVLAGNNYALHKGLLPPELPGRLYLTSLSC